MKRPLIAITMGDPAGVGPEIIVKALSEGELFDACRPLVIGSARRLRLAIQVTGAPLQVHVVDAPSAGSYHVGLVDCLDVVDVPDDLPWGQVSAVGGDAAYQFIAKAVQLIEEGAADAICTAPLNKEALRAGGHDFPGHTEMLAHLTGTPEVSMMLSSPKLKVVHVTTHVGLADAITLLEPGLVSRTIQRGHAALVQSGMTSPRIGVCALNPHGGEHGLFGNQEEERLVAPGVEDARRKGIDATGPHSADTLFLRALHGEFDLVVALYHDQGHIPMKVQGLEAGVNITVGLPVVRTSVDHGTAFDIAGTGRADAASMLEAMRQAIELAPDHLTETGS